MYPIATQMYTERSSSLQLLFSDLNSTSVQKETKCQLNTMKKETEYLFLTWVVVSLGTLSVLSYSYLIHSEDTLLIMVFFKRHIGLGIYCLS